MGFLAYGGAQEYEFDDRTLAHLKAAITMKLRRQESFLVSWTNPPAKGAGRISIWLSPGIPLAFRFAGSRPPAIDKVWLSVLHELSNTPRGLVVISEEEAKRHAARQLQEGTHTETGHRQ
ncbi:DUF7882 family protein [Leucobacter sp. GX24907]